MPRKNRSPGQKLLNIQDLFQTILNAIPESVYMVDREGVILVANSTFSHRMARPLDEVIGETIFDILPPEAAQPHKISIDIVFQSKRQSYFEHSQDGFFFEHYLYPCYGHEGQVDYAVVFAADITDRKQTEEALKASERRYRSVVSTLSEGIILQDANGSISATTTGAMQGDRERRLQAGMDGYNRKPIELEDLARVHEQAPEGSSRLSAPPPAGIEQTAGLEINWDTLRELKESLGDDDGSMMAQIIEIYLLQIPGLIEQLVEAIDRENWELLTRSSHTVKSSSAQLGILQLSRTAEKLESMSRAVYEGMMPPQIIAEYKKMAVEIQRQFSIVAALLSENSHKF